MASARLSRLVRSTLADATTGESDKDWYCRLSSIDKGGAKLYSLAYDERYRIHVVRVQGVRCRTLEEARETLANALEFPEYYGRNTDAFSECLYDLLDISEGGLGSAFNLASRPVDSLILLIDTADDFLSEESDDRAAMFMSLLSRAATEEHARIQADFLVVFCCDEGLPPVLQ